MRTSKTVDISQLSKAGSGSPPADVPASELYRKLSDVVRPSETVDFPRKGADGEPIGQVRMVVLKERELIAAAVEAERFTQRMLRTDEKLADGSQGYLDVYRHESAVQILHRACKRVEDDKANLPVFPTAADIRDALTPDEIGVMLEEYYLVQAKYGPIVGRMGPKELDAWIEKIGQGGAAYPLAFLSSEAKDALIVHICARLRTYLTDSTFAGLQQDESTLSESENVQSNTPPDPMLDV